MRRSGIVIRWFASLLLGLVTTVGVAWSLAMWQPWNEPIVAETWLSPTGNDVSSVYVSQAWQPGVVVRNVYPHEAPPGGRIDVPYTFAFARVLERNEVDESWGLARRALANRELVSGGDEARGWPCVALYNCSLQGGDPPVRYGGIRWREDPLGFYHRFIPLLPIWKGIAVDTAVYCAAWCVVLFAPVSMRGVLRKRRGQCPRCSYDLKRHFDAGCNECGWNKPVGGGAAIHSDHG